MIRRHSTSPRASRLAGGKLYVADTNNHLIRIVDLADNDRVSTFEIQGLTPPARPSRPRRQPPTAAKKCVSTKHHSSRSMAWCG